MRMSIALPIAAALAAAIGLSSPTPAEARKTIASCNAAQRACLRNCVPGDGELARGCRNRCRLARNDCVIDAADGKREGAGGVKPGGGVLSGNTTGGKPKNPVLGGSTGTNAGGKPVVKPISNPSGPFGTGTISQSVQPKVFGVRSNGGGRR